MHCIVLYIVLITYVLIYTHDYILGEWSEAENRILFEAQAVLGNRWLVLLSSIVNSNYSGDYTTLLTVIY